MKNTLLDDGFEQKIIGNKTTLFQQLVFFLPIFWGGMAITRLSSRGISIEFFGWTMDTFSLVLVESIWVAIALILFNVFLLKLHPVSQAVLRVFSVTMMSFMFLILLKVLAVIGISICFELLADIPSDLTDAEKPIVFNSWVAAHPIFDVFIFAFDGICLFLIVRLLQAFHVKS